MTQGFFDVRMPLHKYWLFDAFISFNTLVSMNCPKLSFQWSPFLALHFPNRACLLSVHGLSTVQ